MKPKKHSRPQPEQPEDLAAATVPDLLDMIDDLGNAGDMLMIASGACKMIAARIVRNDEDLRDALNLVSETITAQWRVMRSVREDLDLARRHFKIRPKA